jgi:hypothetical protein
MPKTAAKKTINVTVTFPLADSPYQAEVVPSETVGTVRKDAMEQFGAVEDQEFAYYLTHKGSRLSDEQTIGDVADHAHAIKLTLVKELIQG